MLHQHLLSSSLKKTKIYRTVLGPAVLCGSDIWSVKLREEHRLRVFENRVLRRIFGPKWDDVARKRRKLHNKELLDLYCSPNIITVKK